LPTPPNPHQGGGGGEAKHSQNEHPGCQIMNILNQLFIIMYTPTYF
jgi:hypothetical protein